MISLRMHTFIENFDLLNLPRDCSGRYLIPANFSDDQVSGWVIGPSAPTAAMFDFLGAHSTQIDHKKAVFRVQDLGKLPSKAFGASFGQRAAEDTILQPFPITLQMTGNSPQATRITNVI